MTHIPGKGLHKVEVFQAQSFVMPAQADIHNTGRDRAIDSRLRGNDVSSGNLMIGRSDFAPYWLFFFPKTWHEYCLISP
jgi:hypothetical protein